MSTQRPKGLIRSLRLVLSTSWGLAGGVLVILGVASLGVVAGLDSVGPLFLLTAATVAIVASSQRIISRQQRQLAEGDAARETLRGQYESQLTRLNAQVAELWRPRTGADAQVLLRLHYRELSRRGSGLPPLSDIEFRCRSQNGEDGILLYIFSLIGSTNRRVVEIGVGDGLECNAANLLINHGWLGLLIDGDANQVAAGRTHYASLPDTWVAPPTFQHAWLTRDNVNTVVSSPGFSGAIDLLSLDIDGNDYWIWNALTCIDPRVVVLEFNPMGGPDRSLSMSYSADYRLDLTKRPYRCGASLPAFTKLARTKGYRLVGVQSLGFNAFFVRDGVGEALLPRLSPRECFEQNERLKAWEPSWLEALLSGSEPWEDV